MKPKTNSLNALLDKAIRIAVEAHSGELERNDHPYVTHPFRVMNRVYRVEEKIVAVLHDVIENTSWTREKLEKERFPRDLLDALDGVTIRKGEHYSTAIRRAASNPIARRVKLADLEDNMDVRRLPRITLPDRKRLNRYVRAYRHLCDPAFPG